MNNEFEKIFISSFEKAKKNFISNYKERNQLIFDSEIISIDINKGTFYISSLSTTLPEILLQDRDKSSFLLSYAWKKETYSIVVNKDRLSLELINESSLKIEDDRKNVTLDLIDEELTYLVFSFINYLTMKTKKASD